MIIDTFTFFNELDLLEIRLNTLNAVVDRFVLVEATKTFQNNDKPLYYYDNKQRFEKFADKIVHVVVDDMPDSSDPWILEAHQRNAIARGLIDCKPGTQIIISDVDEIPNPEVVESASKMKGTKLFRQTLFYYYLNNACDQMQNLPWSAMVDYMNGLSPQKIRNLVMELSSKLQSNSEEYDKNIVIIDNGGWHFSYLGGVESIITKIKSYSHNEYNNEKYLDTQIIADAISRGIDIFGRNLTFTPMVAEYVLPEYIVKNADKFDKYLCDIDECNNEAKTGKICETNKLIKRMSSHYYYEFDPFGDSTAAKVVGLIGKNKNVLELGCACGVMSKILCEYAHCSVFGVECDQNSAEYARPYCEELAIVDIDTANWDEILGDRTFDIIVAADVLEHLRDPQGCLRSLLRHLNSDGYVVISVPNVCYNGIVSELITNDFKYRETGLLDYTHLRYWSLNSLEHMLSEAGLTICCIETRNIEPEFSEFSSSWDKLPEWLASALKTRQQGNVYQYIIKAMPTINLNSAENEEYSSICNIKRTEKSIDFTNSLIEQIEQVKADLDILIAERDVAAKERDVAVMERDIALERVEHIKNGFSWRITRPLRFAARLFRFGLTKQDQQQLSQLLLNRYHDLPLPLPARRLVSFTYHRFLRQVGRSIQRVFLRAAKFRAPTIRPISQNFDKPDYIFWGVIDWHFRHQRPQQLALALAASGHRVFYVSPSLIDDERVGFEIEQIGDTAQIFQVQLFAEGAMSIYSGAPSPETITQLRQSIGEVLIWAESKQIVSIVDHPFWHDIASVLPNGRFVYDCMDYHEGFGNNAESLIQLEKRLLSEAELIITTSTWLDEFIPESTRRRTLIRNACDYKHFAQTPNTTYKDAVGRRVIGYYGAIAEWFDLDLVEAVARQHPDCHVILIGSDTVNAKAKLSKLQNVTFTGEVPYGQLPYYLYGFDVCLLPFKTVPLTLATNPVKAYEYLCAGKPIVAVDLPEMTQFEGLVYTAAGKDAFLLAVRTVLSQSEPKDLVQRRKLFAQGQTWQHRAEMLVQQAESSECDPKVSVVVVTYNNLDLTRQCLESLERYSQYEKLEIIVVDNASSDGSPSFLSAWVDGKDNRRLICNHSNRGFAAANNQGLEVATGEYLVLLNNDTYVTPGWVRTLVRHLERDRTIGLIGPVTNNIGNEARININYTSMEDMQLKSLAYTCRHIGQTYPLRTAAFFCVMMLRTTYESVGALDETFGRGFFEDDDYCRRIEQFGLRILCAEDVFVHHYLSASFNKLKQQERDKLFEENKKIYEAKWGEWIPHSSRGSKA